MIKQERFPLKDLNTFGLDVKAKYFIEYSSEDELISILPDLSNEKFIHIGGGSNLLFTQDYEGIVLHSAIRGYKIVKEDAEHIYVRVGAGVVWDEFVQLCVNNGWSGAENLSIIPGEVGASAVQNIGAYGVEAKDLIEEVEIIDLHTGKKQILSNEECHYSYRNSIFKKEYKGRFAVTYVTYKLSKTFVPNIQYGALMSKFKDTDVVTLQKVRDAVIAIRDSKLPNPNTLGNAGSFFMNPVVTEEKFLKIQKEYHDMPFYKVDGGIKIPAGWMIETCGWKGKNLGNAAVYSKQALVIVNLGGATSAEIINLCNKVRESVKDKFDLDISPEVIFVS